MKGIFIDSAKREIRPVEYATYRELGTFVGGLLCVAWTYENGDVIFVDDEGLLKPQEFFFGIKGRPDQQPMAGNGILCGQDGYDDAGEETTLDPVTTVEELRENIVWLTRDQVASWAADNFAKPAMSFTTYDTDSNLVKTEVVSTYGEVMKTALSKK